MIPSSEGTPEVSADPRTRSAVESVQTDWRRLHPLSPILRSGRFVIGILAVVVQQGVVRQSLLGGLAVLGVVVPISLLSGYLSWRVTRWRLADGELQIDSGLLQRRQRRVPLARLQSVDVVRPLSGRFLGLAEVRLEVVGSNDSEARLSLLTEAEAQRVRERLLALDAVLDEAVEGEPANEPEERLLVKVPSRVLVVSILLGFPTIVVGAVILVVAVTAAVSPPAAGGLLALAVPVLLISGQQIVTRLLKEYDFEVAESADGLRLRHGLLEKRAQTIPVGRVQTVLVVQPLLWRRRGWVRVEVDVAGYAGGEDQAVTSALLPVAPREFAEQLVDRVLQAPLPRPQAPVPGSARLLAPLERDRLLLALDDRFLVASSGWLVRRTRIVPLAKIQSLRSTQGPVQRRLGLATLHADSAGRRITGLSAQHRAAPEVASLLDELSIRARAARAAP